MLVKTCLILSSFTMQGVMTTPFAIFLHLDTIRIVLLVLLGRIVTALALGAGKGDQSTHEFSSYVPISCNACLTHEFHKRSPQDAGSALVQSRTI